MKKRFLFCALSALFLCSSTICSQTNTKTVSFQGEKQEWKGYDKYSFDFEGQDAICVSPKKAAPGNPWIWRPAFFGAFPSVDEALLAKGYYVVYYDLTHLYGSPHSVRLGTDFYNFMCDHYGLSRKVTVEGFSRGGLFAMQWASKNPEKVACVYVDAPVCDLRSWPGRKDTTLWSGFLKEWGIKDEAVSDSFAGNTLNVVDKLVKAQVPVISVCGAADKTVPYAENMKKVRDAYQSKGGVVEIIVKPTCDHHPHSLENPEPVVDFIQRYQASEAGKSHINYRGNLDNAFAKFVDEKKGCVAFLGGSITEMKGWRDMIKEDLRQRFPYTEFTFTDAGIASTGTTPHAYRFENDVLNKGVPDLLFVEAAVNDATNGFTPMEQVRGMEGIIRHALRANPRMDIIMMHLVYDPFIDQHQKGQQPDVILNHERVANHYLVPSINLSQEVSERIGAKEFTWEEFGGVHPAWIGHKYYAAAINRVFDYYTKPTSKYKTIAHEMPQPLDNYSYDQGEFIDISAASKLKGFKIDPQWKPKDEKIGTRPGFVNVPMLVANSGNASLHLDFSGKAVGIFCVSGPEAAVLEYSIDGSPYKKLDTYTQWSNGLYLPWVYMLETQLSPGKHHLKLRVAKGGRTECEIRNFVVNR